MGRAAPVRPWARAVPPVHLVPVTNAEREAALQRESVEYADARARAGIWPREEALAMLEGRAREVESSIIAVLNQRNQIAERLESDRQLLQTLVSRQNQQD